VKREVDYTWRLAELMAAHGMHNSTDLIPRLAERGIQLSRPQVYRVVHQRPERVSLQLMSALCDILGCGVEDLVTVTATDVRRRKTASGAAPTPPPNVVELNKSVRPRRARVITDGTN
jgi:DNA-binding Xre family transcriptional regulator